MAADDHLTNGTNITPAIWNAVMDEIKALRQFCIAIGGTVGATEIPATAAGGRSAITTDGSGNQNISFGVTFDSPPAVTVSGWGQNPNVLMTIATSGTPVSTTGFRVHCHDVSQNQNFANKAVVVSWTAITRNGPNDTGS